MLSCGKGTERLLQIDHENPEAEVRLPTDDLVAQWLPGAADAEPTPAAAAPAAKAAPSAAAKAKKGTAAESEPEAKAPEQGGSPGYGEPGFVMPRELARQQVLEGAASARRAAEADLAARVEALNALSDLKCHYALDVPFGTRI